MFRRVLRSVALLALLPLPALALNPGNPDPDPNPGTPTACSGTSLRAGQSTRTITVNGQRREYILWVPSSYDSTRETPLLLDFHALSRTARSHRDSSGTATVAEREGFIVAYPQGIDNAWNLGPCCTRSRTVDDVAFARAIVQQVVSEGCIDERRIYATGFSNGGGMAYKLACDAADMVAAVAPAAFDLIEEMPCRPSRPVSVFSYRGQRDLIVPYNGGRSTPPTSYRLDPIHFLGAEGTLNTWGQLNGCPLSPRNLGNNCQGWTNCSQGTEAVLCTARLGGHSAWDANQSWNFLKNHRLPN